MRARALLPSPRLIDMWIARRWRAEIVRASSAATGTSARGKLQPIALITGASRGIGLAMAQRLRAQRVPLLLIARSAGPLEAAAASLRIARPDLSAPAEPSVLTLALDVGRPDAPARIDAFAREHGYYVDLVINNAGVGIAGAFTAHNAATIEAVLSTNIAALTRITHHFLPQMVQRGAGGILNVASLGGYVPGPYQAAYYASKAYVISLTEAVAHEVRGQGVRIAVCVPGPIATGFHETMGAQSAIYHRVMPHLSADRVARAALHGLRMGQLVIVPGLVEKPIWAVLGVLPRRLLTPLVAALLKPRGDVGHDRRQ